MPLFRVLVSERERKREETHTDTKTYFALAKPSSQERAHSKTQIGTAQSVCAQRENIKNQRGWRNPKKKHNRAKLGMVGGKGGRSGELNSRPININEGDNKIRRLPRAGVRAQRRRINANCFQFEFLPRPPPGLHAKFHRCAAAEQFGLQRAPLNRAAAAAAVIKRETKPREQT